ncbi:acyltransferase [Streptomyces beihaiensis]|uniref:Acyltransferase n=1 Tax=Streptomyces beihaiensis TaxID=2984495 RepID=A0ABT3TYN2_9ACTN|nr:acyltransferase [Streptomyces beihaiensis]MCX3062129.1 acyltransferase [Streptomyces beihaiensis]
MSTRVRLREAWTITSGEARDTVVQCGSTDTTYVERYVPVAFFFERTVNEERLAEGLRRALGLVPVFGGRLRADGDTLEIVCSDAGVPMTVLDVDASLGDAIQEATHPDWGLIDRVDVMSEPLELRPLLTVRVCRLADGATTLGCTWNHSVGDMGSFMQFIRVWSALVEGTAPPEVLMVDDREGYLDRVLPQEDSGQPVCQPPSPDESAGQGRTMPLMREDNGTVQVYFGDDEVRRMRHLFGDARSRPLSSNDVLCAHLATAFRGMEANPVPWNLSIPVDLRFRLGVPTGFLGNLVQSMFLPCPPKGTADVLAAHIRSGLDDFMQSHRCMRSDRAFVGPVGRSRFHRCTSATFDPPHRTFIVTNWTRVGVYDVAFDGQYPAFFSPVVSSRAPLSWFGFLTRGFGGTGFLLTAVVPARLAEHLRSPEGRAAIHHFEDPAAERPARAVLAPDVA